MRFKIGDVVIKNTGGNKMTIEGFRDSLIYCVWFVGSNLYRSSFDQRELVTIDEYRMILLMEERDDKLSKVMS